MYYPNPPRLSFWQFALGMLGIMLLGSLVEFACASNPAGLQVENPSELCASAVAMSSTVKAQAAKLGLEPIELARRTCDAAILAAQVAEANLPKASGIAGTTSSSVPPSMALAGAAGSGS